MSDEQGVARVGVDALLAHRDTCESLVEHVGRTYPCDCGAVAVTGMLAALQVIADLPYGCDTEDARLVARNALRRVGP